MRPIAWASAGVLTLAPLALLSACPALDAIHVGSAPDAASDLASEPPPSDAGTDSVSSEGSPADAGPTDAPCEADVRSDPHNCGACGHDCLGATCTLKACDPITLYMGDTPSSLVVDGKNLFATITSSDPYAGIVLRCDVDDCMKTQTTLASSLVSPWFAVAHDGQIFWNNGGTLDDGGEVAPGSIVSCPETGCGDAGPTTYTPEGGAEEAGNLSGLALDSTFIYWAGSTFGLSALSGNIFRCAATACASTTVALVSGPNLIPLQVQVDKSHVYWTDLGTNQVLRCKLPSCGGNPQIFANDQTSASGLYVFQDQVYWTQGITDGGVFTCPSTGCGPGPTVIALGQGYPLGLAVDDSGVYWSNIDDGTILHCPLTGCTKPKVIASTFAPFAIALDAVSVYYSNSTLFGAIYRVAK